MDQTNKLFLDVIDATGGSAYPAEFDLPEGGQIHCAGLTIRDWFAGQAMHAVLRNAGRHFHSTEEECTECRAQTARIAYATADAMLAARSKAGGE